MKQNRFLLSLIFLLLINTISFGQNIKLDKKLGKKNYETVKASYKFTSDKAMNTYLNNVGQRLVSNLDSALFEYQFFIINDPIPNAFALPGGYIFITSGLVILLKSEDELAGVIGHEIIHSNNRHSVRQIRKRILPTILTLPITILGAVTPGVGAITAPINATQSLLFASYSRKYETEADELGVTLAAKSGYDPLALPKALDRLMKAIEYLTGEKEKKNYFADHPYTPTRDKRIKEISKNLEISKTEPISKHFLSEFNGITYGYSPENGIIQNNTFLNPNKDFRIKFPKYWNVLKNDTTITAYSPHKDAAFSLSYDNSNLSGKEASKKYINKLSKKQKKLIVNSGEYEINNTKAYIVNFQDIFLSDTTFASIIWLPVGDNLYKISTMSDIEDNITISEILRSIRALNSDEKNAIKIQYISLVKARENETLEELSKRTNNLINPELTAIINGLNIKQNLKKGQEIKIVLDKAYVKERN